MKKRWLYLILAVMFLFVLMPYLIWQATWFGKPLNDKQMADAFADTDHPRNAQHEDAEDQIDPLEETQGGSRGRNGKGGR